MLDGVCVVCRRREPSRGRVCDTDIKTTEGLLGDLPRKMVLLPMMLLPGQSPAGEKVATTRVGSPTSARLDALSLVGPGSVAVPGALHPLMRRWSTTRTVQVHTRVGMYQVETRSFDVVDWHQEPVLDRVTGEPVLVTDGDQVGVSPPAEWLDRQVRSWRAAFGHHRPPAAYVSSGRGPRPPRDPIRWVLTHGTKQQVETMFAVQELTSQYRQGLTDLAVGFEPGNNGRRPNALREDDPVADLWTARFGEATLSPAAKDHIRYLHTWLPAAAEHDAVDVAQFVAELRSLSAELTRVLGERPDQQWLGKCPATLIDVASGGRAPCGAGLWQDPHASVVECPRCHSAWGPRTVHLVHLAAEIRRVWPLDQRRRYNADEIDALRPIPCPGCALPVTVTWQEVTAAEDGRRWWRPARAGCPDDCGRAGDVF
jgi:hypothetical protein